MILPMFKAVFFIFQLGVMAGKIVQPRLMLFKTIYGTEHFSSVFSHGNPNNALAFLFHTAVGSLHEYVSGTKLPLPPLP